MSVAAFVEQLGSVGPDRMLRLVNERTVSSFYVLVGPDEGRPAASANRVAWFDVDEISPAFVPRGAWWICTSDQAADVARITELDAKLNPTAWILDIEKSLEGAKLDVLIGGVAALGKPIVASLGGAYSPSHMEFDYRTLDLYRVVCDWQAYFDSGEGCTPAQAVQELYSSTFVLPGWEYRHRLGAQYGWGRVNRVEGAQRALYDSYRRPGTVDGYFSVSQRIAEDGKAWGYNVISRTLHRDGKDVGLLMGRAAYPKIAVTLDVTRTAQARAPQEWTPIAASARVNGAARRPVSIYLLDNASDEVVRAIAAGSA